MLTDTVSLSGTTTTYGYDGAGDRTSQQDSAEGSSASDGYDQADRLTSAVISATSGITTASYAYDGDGVRQSKTVTTTGGVTTTAEVWDTSGALPLPVQDGATKYLTGPDGLPLEQIDGSGHVAYDLHDQLGSTRLLLDGSGATLATYTYDTYGNLVSSTGSATTPFGFAGEYTDAETGFQYLRARYYDPTTGQFSSVDPLEGVTQQPYAYTADDPLNATDPSGLCSYIPCQDYGSGADTASTPSLADAPSTLLEDSALAALLRYAPGEPCLYGSGTAGGPGDRITAAGALPLGSLGALGALGAASLPEDVGLGAVALAGAPVVATGAAIATLGGVIYTQEILGPDALYPPPAAPAMPIATLPGYASSPGVTQITATYPDPGTRTIGLAPEPISLPTHLVPTALHASSNNESSGTTPSRVYDPVPALPGHKHGPGGWGTLMDLDPATAQEVLNGGTEAGKRVYGLHEGQSYEFQPDNAGSFHGYPVPGSKVPPPLLRQWRDDGSITKSEYERLRKGRK